MFSGLFSLIHAWPSLWNKDDTCCITPVGLIEFVLYSSYNTQESICVELNMFSALTTNSMWCLFKGGTIRAQKSMLLSVWCLRESLRWKSKLLCCTSRASSITFQCVKSNINVFLSLKLGIHSTFTQSLLMSSLVAYSNSLFPWVWDITSPQSPRLIFLPQIKSYLPAAVSSRGHNEL